jgi:flavorubredoxin
MAQKLYDNGTHQCIGFYDLISDGGVQANQFLLIDSNHSAFIDPGGLIVYKDLLMCSAQFLAHKKLDYIISSHQGPDALSSVEKWLVETDGKIVVPTLWKRFMSHYVTPGQFNHRIIGIPDQGMILQLGQTRLKIIPAHFLHSEGNFQCYDPISKILFSGDMGASLFLRYSEKVDQPVEDFDNHIANMESFHRRCMACNKICRYWVNMVRGLDIEWIIPQHGRSFKGKVMVERFLKWIEELQCGADLVSQKTYSLP